MRWGHAVSLGSAKCTAKRPIFELNPAHKFMLHPFTGLSWLRDLHYNIVVPAWGAHVNQVHIIKGDPVRSHACSFGLATKYKKIEFSDQRPLVSGA